MRKKDFAAKVSEYANRPHDPATMPDQVLVYDSSTGVYLDVSWVDVDDAGIIVIGAMDGGTA